MAAWGREGLGPVRPEGLSAAREQSLLRPLSSHPGLTDPTGWVACKQQTFLIVLEAGRPRPRRRPGWALRREPSSWLRGGQTTFSVFLPGGDGGQ